jgi:hypothetical protein
MMYKYKWLMLIAVVAILLVSGTVMMMPRAHATTVTATTPVVGMARTSTNGGYWITTQDGAVYSFGNANYHGGANQLNHNGTIVGIAATSTDGGYWEVGSDGGVYSFGDAVFHGSMGGKSINAPIVSITRTSTNGGYWLVGADGGVYAFGDAGFYGSMGGKSINAPVSGIVATGTGQGYWLVGADGGVYAFGDAHFYGSMGGQHLNAPVVGIDRTSTNGGYWLVGADGGIFSFGDAHFYGSMGGQHLNAPMVGVGATLDNGGYWEVGSDGGIFSFGNAQYYGNVTVTAPSSPTGSTAQLAQQVLNNSNIALTGRCVRDDIVYASQGHPSTAGTLLSPKLLSDLLAIASSQKVVVTAIESCGSGHTAGSNHYRGTALDLAVTPGSGNTMGNITATIYNNRSAWSIDELIHDPMPMGTTTLKYGKPFTYSPATLKEHRDHVHYSVQ